MKTLREKQRDADRLAEAEKLEAIEEQERLEAAIEAEQCAFVDAADAIAALLLGDLDAEVALNELFYELGQIRNQPVFYSEALIDGLRMLANMALTSHHSPEQSSLLLMMLEVMAAHDPTSDAGPGSGQIERQAKESREALDESDS